MDDVLKPLPRFTYSVDDNFVSKMSEIIDSVASISEVKVVSGKKKSSWRSFPPVRSEKRDCQKSEHRWQMSGLQKDLSTLRSSAETLTMLMPYLPWLTG